VLTTLGLPSAHNDPRACDPTLSLSGGCERCRPLHLDYCCDLCAPASFTLFNVAPPEVAERPRQRYGINKFKTTEEDKDLEDALHAYRKATARAKFGADARQYGAGFWMPDAVFDRVLGLAHYRKLTSLAELTFELSDWLPRDLSAHGDEILELVNKHILQEPPASTASGDAPKEAMTNTCSVCAARGRDPRGHRCKPHCPFPRIGAKYRQAT
jgi:hypothetical protein